MSGVTFPKGDAIRGLFDELVQRTEKVRPDRLTTDVRLIDGPQRALKLPDGGALVIHALEIEYRQKAGPGRSSLSHPLYGKGDLRGFTGKAKPAGLTGTEVVLVATEITGGTKMSTIALRRGSPPSRPTDPVACDHTPVVPVFRRLTIVTTGRPEFTARSRLPGRCHDRSPLFRPRRAALWPPDVLARPDVVRGPVNFRREQPFFGQSHWTRRRHDRSGPAGPDDPAGGDRPRESSCGSWPNSPGRERRAGDRRRPARATTATWRTCAVRQGLRRGHLRPRARAHRAHPGAGGGGVAVRPGAGRARARPGQGRDARAADRDRRAVPGLARRSSRLPTSRSSPARTAGRWCSRRYAAVTTGAASGSAGPPRTRARSWPAGCR